MCQGLVVMMGEGQVAEGWRNRSRKVGGRKQGREKGKGREEGRGRMERWMDGQRGVREKTMRGREGGCSAILNLLNPHPLTSLLSLTHTSLIS